MFHERNRALILEPNDKTSAQAFDDRSVRWLSLRLRILMEFVMEREVKIKIAQSSPSRLLSRLKVDKVL